MIRNLLSKLPGLKCTSEYAISSLYRHRAFRSLSPNDRGKLKHSAEISQRRPASCSRTEKSNSQLDGTDVKQQTRHLCFSKEYYAKTVPSPSEVNEIQWRDTSEKQLREPSHLNKEDSSYSKLENSQFETLEQYELEAARPRPSRSRDVLEAFALKSKKIDRYVHLQPSQMKPYGSSENLYSPMLIRPTNTLKYPRRFKKSSSSTSSAPPSPSVVENQEFESRSNSELSPGMKGQRNYSTSTIKKLSTSKACISKEGQSTKCKTDNSINIDEAKEKKFNELKFPSPAAPTNNFMPKISSSSNYYENHWINCTKSLDFAPPSFQAIPNNLQHSVEETFEISTPAMRKERLEKENSLGSSNYKSSYSDLIKLRQKKGGNNNNNDLMIPISTSKVCTSCIAPTRTTSGQILENIKNVPSKRSLATNSKNKLVVKNVKNYSSYQPVGGKKSKKSINKKKNNNRKYNPDCQDICTRTVEENKFEPKRFPYEPAVECGKEPEVRKVFLPSKVKLPIHPCLARPPYQDCKPEKPCSTPRADECIEYGPKELPKIPVSPCPCIDPPPPAINPKLHRLCFKFEDPPKVICHPPPCQTPRSDDITPYKHKPLKPYIPPECACIEPPALLGVKLKRLPKCEPEEICRPPRVCPIIEPCPPRADECYRVVPKKLPPLVAPTCPCVESPPPTIAPPIRRLNLDIDEPERQCPPPKICPKICRADDDCPPKPRKLPKFVPGPCPCEDKPLVDWNLKRLVCEDEDHSCIVPDPCRAFPRADWGCWEYAEEVCDTVDVDCLDKADPCAKPKKEKPCRKPNICETSSAGLLDIRNGAKRKFSHSSSSSSLKLYRRMKDSNNTNNDNLLTRGGSEILNNKKRNLRMTTRKLNNAPAVQLIKMLNSLDNNNADEEQLLFKPKKSNKIDYNHILKTIASTTAELEKQELAKNNSITNQSLKKPKRTTIRVTSRAISTVDNLNQSEKELKKARNCKAKETCKNLKPKSLMCRKPCASFIVPCPHTESSRDKRPGCPKERVPVCCQKEESPYSAFSEKFPRVIPAYTTATPQWTCCRKQYGFYPHPKKEHDPLAANKKKNKNCKKQFSTFSLVDSLPLPENLKYNNESSFINNSLNIPNPPTRPVTRRFMSATSSKAFLMKTSTPNLSSPISRHLATKVFQIHPPEPCKKVKIGSQTCDKIEREEKTAPKITCYTKDPCEQENKSGCALNDYGPINAVRKPPPFPAFSDCLDEEMEDILTECPLDKEKFHRMQPSHVDKRLHKVIEPPPSQGKLDLLKEQQCLREKFDLENEGVTQTCQDFGDPIPLMKTKDLVKEENKDCKRVEELKKMGRWPPFTLKSNRRYSTSTTNFISIRKYHALIKLPRRNVLADSFEKLKEATKKIILQNNNNKEENGKLKTEIHNNVNFLFEQVKKESKVAKKLQRCYSTFKTRSRNIVRKKGGVVRSFSCTSPLLKRIHPQMRGKRFKSNNKKNSHGKFNLSGGSVKGKSKSGFSQKCFDVEKIDKLQPRLTIGREPTDLVKEYPSQDTIDRSMGAQYYNAKKGGPNHGNSISCDTFGDFFKGEKPNIAKEPGVAGNTVPDSAEDICEEKKSSAKSFKKTVIEFIVQKHKKLPEDTTCCSQTPQDPCEVDRKKLEEICMKECLKSIPCDLPEEEKYCICKERCKKVCKKCEEPKPKQSACPVPAPPIKPPEKPKPIKRKVLKVLTNNCKVPAPPCCTAPKPPPCPPPKPVCPPKKPVCPPAPCGPKKSKSLTQLECIWQKIISYFKARPNCPQPGDYKKKMLKEKAQKAANAAGLVVVDPKCLPTDMVKSFQTPPKKDCKACPNNNNNNNESKESSSKGSPKLNSRHFSTSNYNHQSARNYSNSCKNLEEINKILEECEIQRRKVRFALDNANIKNNKEFVTFPARKDSETAKALKLSLDQQLHKRVNLSELCLQNGKYSKTYFGYSNIIPSRENILERAWRISIEAYNKYNYPKHINIFELFNKMERTHKSLEDLEKLKTERVLQELEDFLKNEEDPNKKKK